MVGLTITGNQLQLAVGASNSTIKGTYTILKRYRCSKVVNTALAKIQRSVTDISGTADEYAYGYPIDTNSSLLLLKKLQ
jgi:hypothetical protein